MNPKAKKAVKITLWSVLSLLGVIVLLLLTSPMWLGPTAKSIANSIVPEMVGTKFEVKKASIDIFSGKISVDGIHLGNPEGYKPAEAAKIGTLFIHVDMGTVLSDVIHFKEITIDEVFASYVSNKGTNNFEWISNYMEQRSSKDDKKDKKATTKDEESDIKIIIDRLNFSNAAAQFEFIPIPLPSITLTDIGKKSNGATLSETWDQIWSYIKKNFMKTGDAIGGLLNSLSEKSDSAINDITQILGGTTQKPTQSNEEAKKTKKKNTSDKNIITDTAQSAGDAVGSAVQAVGDVASGTVDATGKGINKATDAVTGSASKLFKKAGRLFKKD